MGFTRFFKIILRSTPLENEVSLPPKFVWVYGRHISHNGILSTDCNLRWTVEFMKKSPNEILMCGSGFRTFMQHYQIAYGDLLVFRHLGQSNFHVGIFRSTACEIEYPFVSAVDESAEFPEAYARSRSPCIKRRENASPREKHKKPCRKTGITINDVSNSELGSRHSPILVPDGICKSEKGKGKSVAENISRNISSRNAIYINDNCFVKFVESSAVTGNQSMALPAFFVRLHEELWGEYTSCTVTGPGEPEQLCDISVHFRKKLPEVYVNRGWKNFSAKVHLSRFDQVRFDYSINAEKGLPEFRLKMVDESRDRLNGSTSGLGDSRAI